MKAVAISLAAISSLLLISCASLTEEKCIKSDWQAIGQRDGREGRPDRSREIQEQCAREGVELSRKNYVHGYLTGLAAFCSKENGKVMGQQGEQYGRQCPIELEPKFLEGYYEGRSQYESLKTQRELYAAIRTPAPPSAGSGAQRCNFDSDCQIPSACQDGRCNSNGAACHFNSDCTFKGTCLENRCDYPDFFQRR